MRNKTLENILRMITELETLKEAYVRGEINEIPIYASIGGKGVHIGHFKGVSYEDNGAPAFEVDIEPVSCTGECFFDTSNIKEETPAVVFSCEGGSVF